MSEEPERRQLESSTEESGKVGGVDSCSKISDSVQISSESACCVSDEKKLLLKESQNQTWVLERRQPQSSSSDEVSSQETVMSQTKQDVEAQKVSAVRSYVWEYLAKLKNQSKYPWRAGESEPDPSSKSQSSGTDNISQKDSEETINAQMKQEADAEADKLSTRNSYIWEYITKLKNQTHYPWRAEESEPLGGPSSKSQSFQAENVTTQQISEDTINSQTTQTDAEADKMSARSSYIWEYFEKLKSQTNYPWRAEESPRDPSAKSQSYSSDSRQGLKEAAQMIREELSSRSHVLGYFSGMLSDAYKDAGRRLQDTRHIIRSVGVGEMRDVVSQYVTLMSKELPLIHRAQLWQVPDPHVHAEDKVVDLSGDCGVSVVLGFSGWPGGSVTSIRDTSPEVFYQELVELPPALSQLKMLSSQQVLEKLESLSPERQGGKAVSVFWLKAANRGQPVPKAVCLFLSDKHVTAVAGASSTDTLTTFHHLELSEIREVQISLAGQHVRLISSNKDVLAIFTHSKELTQELCKALLKACAPDSFSEDVEDHPLLSDDLMVLSLDWTSNVPDMVLDGGLHMTSRFKRVLADLLYMVHGNMLGPGRPSLANIRPLLYTTVRVKNSGRVRQDTIFQFLLTDTHVALLQEDGVFHPVPRGSSLVPVQSQFQRLEVRRRSDIRCLLVRKDGGCLNIDVVFVNQKEKTLKRKAELRRCSADTSSASTPSDDWKLVFGCSTEAQMLIKHLCS